MKFSQPTRKKTKEKQKISQMRNKLKWENKKAPSHDPTSVDHQSSFIENWWCLTGVRLCKENYKLS